MEGENPQGRRRSIAQELGKMALCNLGEGVPCEQAAENRAQANRLGKTQV